MGWVLIAIASVLFFLAAVGSTVIPDAGAWGMVALSLGFAIGSRGSKILQSP